jgi:hypothetical protein
MGGGCASVCGVVSCDTSRTTLKFLYPIHGLLRVWVDPQMHIRFNKSV